MEGVILSRNIDDTVLIEMHSFLLLWLSLIASVVAVIDFYSCAPHGDILDITVTKVMPDPPRIGRMLGIMVINY